MALSVSLRFILPGVGSLSMPLFSEISLTRRRDYISACLRLRLDPDFTIRGF